MGPVGQIVKIFYYACLGTELALEIAIYILATMLLCSRMIIPDLVLVHGVIALVLAITTLSVIHKGFYAIAHDCSFHLYWFAVIMGIILFIQFMFQIFGLHNNPTNSWPAESKSLQTKDINKDQMLRSDRFQNERHDNLNSTNFDLTKTEYRLPTARELESRKRKLYNGVSHNRNFTTESTKRISQDKDDKVLIHRLYRNDWRSKEARQEGETAEEATKRSTECTTMNTPVINSINAPEKLKTTPIALVFFGYSFLMKLVCSAMAALTAFLFQLEYI